MSANEFLNNSISTKGDGESFTVTQARRNEITIPVMKIELERMRSDNLDDSPVPLAAASGFLSLFVDNLVVRIPGGVELHDWYILVALLGAGLVSCHYYWTNRKKKNTLIDTILKRSEDTVLDIDSI